LLQLDGTLLNNSNNNQQKSEIGLDVMGGRNSESTPTQSLERYMPVEKAVPLNCGVFFKVVQIDK